MTSWNMPPGCNVSDIPGNEDWRCEVCGNWTDDCICPECTVCGCYGEPKCYTYHGMLRSWPQIFSLAWEEAQIEKYWREESLHFEEKHHES